MTTFEERYFIQSETSNYKDYRRRKWAKLADDLISLLNLEKNTQILDFGCATGGLIKELRNRGIKNVKGTDISYWAIEYGKQTLGLKEELEFCNLNLLTKDFDIILFLDVLEHIPTIGELRKLLCLTNADRIIVRVPISAIEGENYVFLVSRNDTTHLQCHTKEWWINLFNECGYKLETFLNGEAIYDSEGVFAGVFTKCR